MKYVKPIVRILLSITLLVVFILACIYMPKQRCERISVVAHTQNESVTLSQKDVESLLSQAKIEVLGKAVKEVDLGEIITLLKANPYISNVNFVHFAGKKPKRCPSKTVAKRVGLIFTIGISHSIV